MVTDCIVDINPNSPIQMIKSALMASPQSSYLKHLTHLAIHKKFGSNDQDRAVLLSDYIKALCGYPEYVVYMVCKHYWENDRRPFVPFISEIRDACKAFTECLERHLRNMQNSDQPAIQKQETDLQNVEEWRPPTDEDKAKVHSIVEECIRNLSA